MASKSHSDRHTKHATSDTHHAHWRTYSPVASRPHIRILRVVLLVCGFILAIASVYQFVVAIRGYAQSSRQPSAPIEFSEQGEQYKVLLLMSYDDSHTALTCQRSGVLDTLALSNITTDVEYLRTKVFPLGTEASDAIIEALTQKLAVRGPYDVIIVADDDALRVVDQRHHNLFGDSPVVFLGINDHEYAREVVGEGWATGVIEVNCFPEMMDLIFRLRPNTDHVVVLTDQTTTGVGDLAQFSLIEDDYPDVRFEVLDAGFMRFYDMRESLRKLEEDAVVVHLDTYVDADGYTLGLSESARYFSDGCPVPIFRGSMGGDGEGICAIAYPDFYKTGQKAATMASLILSGTSPSDIPLDSDNSLGITADARLLQRFGISEALLPSDAVILNSPQDEERRLISPITLPLALMAGSLLAFLAFAYIGYRLSMADAQKLTHTRDILDFELTHNHLTKLPNRKALVAHLEGEDAVCKTRAIIMVDLDDFSNINDTYGMAAGDEVICEVAQRLGNIPCTMLAHVGGDEFLLTFDHPLSPGSSELKLVSQVFDTPISWHESLLSITASMGVVGNSAPGENNNRIRHASLAVRTAKEQSGKHAICFYEKWMSEAFRRNNEITSELRHAIDNDGVLVVYQPQIDTSTHTIYGYEALARLTSGSYSPGEFIPIAEKSGMIIELSRVITRIVVAQQREWLDQGLVPRVVSLNYSTVQLNDTQYCSYLRDLLETFHVPASLIKVEITESMMLGDRVAAEELVTTLTDMGVSLALDDFGTGFSSFDRLTFDAVGFVKLDKTFVDSFLASDTETVTRNLVQLIHDLGKRVVMEGVETRDQMYACVRLGCDFIQGYYYSKPMAPADVPAWVPQG